MSVGGGVEGGFKGFFLSSCTPIFVIHLCVHAGGCFLPPRFMPHFDTSSKVTGMLQIKKPRSVCFSPFFPHLGPCSGSLNSPDTSYMHQV